ncbi:hypothetical protein [Gryllotalpicola koreensis]|uniref:hypothetical protein n=1 Tax=Gryllotalpicola koreensis TaxID=993086 RepID=UPI0031DA2FCE
MDNSEPKWVISRARFPWTGELCWRVSHPSLPAYFRHRLHLNTFEDAIAYVDAKIRAQAQIDQEPSA